MGSKSKSFQHRNISLLADIQYFMSNMFYYIIILKSKTIPNWLIRSSHDDNHADRLLDIKDCKA